MEVFTMPQVPKFVRKNIPVIVAAVLLLSACNLGATPAPTIDVNAINTAAVSTAVAQFNVQLTQTALAIPPTALPTNTEIPTETSLPTFAAPATEAVLPTVSFNTPVAGFTPLATVAAINPTQVSGDACDNNVFIADITVPDGTVMKPGQDFKKIWRVKNTGNCTWDEGYSLVAIPGGDSLDGQTYTIKLKKDFVAPGATVDLGIDMTAHLKPGDYQGCWKMKNDRGFYFGTILCVVIKVK